jgi:hypothetical protein
MNYNKYQSKIDKIKTKLKQVFEFIFGISLFLFLTWIIELPIRAVLLNFYTSQYAQDILNDRVIIRVLSWITVPLAIILLVLGNLIFLALFDFITGKDLVEKQENKEDMNKFFNKPYD